MRFSSTVPRGVGAARIRSVSADAIVTADAAACTVREEKRVTGVSSKYGKTPPRPPASVEHRRSVSTADRRASGQGSAGWRDTLRVSSRSVNRMSFGKTPTSPPPSVRTPDDPRAATRRTAAGRRTDADGSPAILSPDDPTAARRSIIEVPPCPSKLRHFGPPGEVLEGLWIGGMEDARPERVALRGFEIVISLLRYTAFGGIPKYAAGVVTHNYPVVDNGTDPIPFEDVAGKISSGLVQGKCILVHCKQGISRSASAIIAYLILYREMPYDQALELVKKARPSAAPKFGKQLRRLEEEFFARREQTAP
eukprot:Hpha_TRINITY_DN16282_c0_g2::TRINITY_DN16282_c0_g2_i1::g.15293::m.15293